MPNPFYPLAAPLLAVSLLLGGCGGQPAVAPSPGDRGMQHPPVTAEQRQALVHEARAMLGAPYRYGGSSPRGFDCSGLVQYSHAQTGITVPRMARDQRRHARPVPVSRLQPGDLVFFALPESKGDHVGIYVGNGEFIHASSSGKRVSRSRLDQHYWRERLVAAGSYL